jgi:hypothetical protein
VRSKPSLVGFLALLFLSSCDSGSEQGGSGATGGASGGTGGASGGTGGASGGTGGASGGTGGASGGTGGASGGTGGASGSGGSPEDAASDAADVVNCVAEPPVFPAFDRACWESSWCEIVFHQIDCCGNRVALGVVEHEVTRFEVAEAICAAQYPVCGCPVGPTTTDTGQTTNDEAAIDVECRGGMCTTFVP